MKISSLKGFNALEVHFANLLSNLKVADDSELTCFYTHSLKKKKKKKKNRDELVIPLMFKLGYSPITIPFYYVSVIRERILS